MMTGIIVLAATMFGFITGFVRRREDCSSGRDHEPRLLRLLPDGDGHTCRFNAARGGFDDCRLCERGEQQWVETQLGEDTLSLCTVRPYPIVRRRT